MSNPLNVLIVEDSESDAAMMTRLLRKAGYDVRDERVETADEMRVALEKQAWDVVIADYRLPQFDAPAALALLQGTGRDIPFIVVSGTVGEETVVAMMKAGAHDYLMKDKLLRLAPAVEREIQEAHTRRERKRAEARIIHLNEVLRAVRNVNQLITRERDPQRLLSDACAILVRTRGYRMAWIGLIEEGHQRVIPAARAGQGTDYLDQVTITWDESETGQGPAGAAIRTRRPAACRDIAIDPRYAIWREAALAHGFGSSAVAPMVYGERLFGIVTIYADKPETFDDEEVNLLSELANDLAFALQSIEDEAERKQAEGALQEAEARYRSLVEQIPVAVYRDAIDPTSSALYVSPQNEAMLGYSPDEWTADPELWPKLLHPDDRERVLAEHARTNATGDPFKLEYRLVARDGRVVWVHDEAVMVRDSAGRPLYWQGVMLDITARKQTEVALRESEERYRVLFEQARDGIALADTDTGIMLDCNQALADLVGRNRAELIGQHQSILHPPSSNNTGLSPTFKQHMTNQEGQVLATQVLTRTGEIREVEIKANLLYLQGRKALQGIFRDITARRRAEEALRVSEERFALAVQGSNDGLWDWDIRGNTLYWSPRLKELLGYADDELEIDFDTFDSLLHPDDRERVATAIEAHLKDRKPYDVEERQLTKSGEYRWYRARGQALWDEAGNPVRMVGFTSDITERKQMEQALRDKVAALQTLNEIDREVIAATESQTILDLVCRRAAELVRVEKSAIATQTASGEMAMAASCGLGDAEHARDEFARVWRAGLTRSSGLRPDAIFESNDLPAQDSHMLEFSARENVHATAYTPLAVGEKTLGALLVFDTAPREWSADERQILSLLAGQAALALEKARLYEMARSRAAHLETLNTIGQAITSILDLDRILDILLESVTRVTDVEACSVALVEAGADDLVFRKAGGQAGWVVVGMRLKLGQGIAGWVAQHRQPVMLLDAASDPRFYSQVDGLTGYVTRNIACVPLVAHDRVIGVIELINQRSGAFSQDDLRLLESVAAQTAVAIENARLFETERSARQRFETLFGIGQAVNSTLDAEAILDRLTDEAMRATHATHGSAIIARTDLERFDRRSLRGYTPDQAERARSIFLPLDRGLNGRAYRTRQIVYLPDVRTDPDYFALIPETRSELVVPILRGGQVLANLDLQSSKVDAFRDVDTELLLALIDQVAIALENARLFEETRRRLDEMAIVSQVALMGAAGRPFDEAVSRAVEAMCYLWQDSSVSFLFVDETGQVLRLHPASRGVSSELVADFCVPLGQGITGWVARERQPVRVGDVTLDARYVVGMSGARSEMAAPLLVGERVIGVINVECPWPNSYSGDDLRVLTALSSQLATIFEKSRLDAELAEYTATLERRVEERTAEIRHQQTRTQAILDALGEGVIVTDIQGNIEYVNAAGLALTGYGTQEALGRNPRLWQSGQTPLSVYQEMWSTILLGRTWRGEIVNKRRDGTLYHVDLTIAPIPILDAPGLIAGFAGVQHDVSLRKRAEEEIHRALAQEKELGELKSRFISMTSHEFRTPLTTILSSAEMLEHYGPRWSEDKKLVHIHRIQSSVRNMTRLLDDVLILGRAEAGRFEFNPIPLDLVQFCRDLIEEMQLSAGPKYALELTCEAAGAQAHMDEKLLRQILTNLLSNAIKYSPDGGTVHLTLACQAGRVTFQVRDDGIGIPDEDQARLFETFHRARNIGNIPGTGLGLAIVKKSVDLHGGTIEVASQVGQGTTFTVTLPMENTA